MKRIAYLLCSFLCFACLESVDFGIPDPEKILVVDGVFTNSVERDQVKLGYTIAYGSQKFFPLSGAVVQIFDERGESEGLVEIRPGVYEFKKEHIVGVIGKKYFLEIKLPDGTTYRSEPEMMYDVPPIDSLSYNLEIEELVNDFGAVLDSRNFVLDVHTRINQEGQQAFLKWNIEHIYLFPEFYNPPLPQHICYVQEELEPQKIYVLNGSNFRANTAIQQTVGRKRLNHTFSFPQSYRVSQYSITEKAYHYFDDLNEVSNPNGNIFDLPPSALSGNMYNVNGEEQVLGYFSIAAVTTQVLFVSAENIRSEYTPFDLCNFKQLRPRNYDLPAECFDCLLIENSNLEKPFYW